MAENETTKNEAMETQTNALRRFLNANTPGMKCARTIVQGVIGVFAANIDVIVGAYVLDPVQRAIAVPLVMAVLSPVMAMLGEAGE